MSAPLLVRIPFKCDIKGTALRLQRMLKKNSVLILSGLEGAVVCAMDVALVLESSNIVAITNTVTSYDEFVSKVTGNSIPRAKIMITITAI